MRSTRLAILAVTVGTALLGWSTAGVTAVAGSLSQTAAPAQPHDHHGHDHGDHGHHGGPGGV